MLKLGSKLLLDEQRSCEILLLFFVILAEQPGAHSVGFDPGFKIAIIILTEPTVPYEKGIQHFVNHDKRLNPAYP